MSKKKRCNAGSAKPTEWHFAKMIHPASERSYTLCETKSLSVEGGKRLPQSCQSLLEHLQVKVFESSNFTLALFAVLLCRPYAALQIVTQPLLE